MNYLNFLIGLLLTMPYLIHTKMPCKRVAKYKKSFDTAFKKFQKNQPQTFINKNFHLSDSSSFNLNHFDNDEDPIYPINTDTTEESFSKMNYLSFVIFSGMILTIFNEFIKQNFKHNNSLYHL